MKRILNISSYLLAGLVIAALLVRLLNLPLTPENYFLWNIRFLTLPVVLLIFIINLSIRIPLTAGSPLFRCLAVIFVAALGGLSLFWLGHWQSRFERAVYLESLGAGSAHDDPDDRAELWNDAGTDDGGSLETTDAAETGWGESGSADLSEAGRAGDGMIHSEGELIRRIRTAEPGTILTIAGQIHLKAPLKISGKKQLTLLGQRGQSEILVENRFIEVIIIENSSGIVLDGLKLYHQTPQPCDEGVILLLDSERVSIRNCEIHGSGYYGIFTSASSRDITIQNNLIHHSTWFGLQIGSTNTIIRNNNFRNNGFSGKNDILVTPLAAKTIHLSRNSYGSRANTLFTIAKQYFELIPFVPKPTPETHRKSKGHLRRSSRAKQH
jgi:parallel beta-helix repeat protein